MSSPDAVICTMASGPSAELLGISRPTFQAYAAVHGFDFVERPLPGDFPRPPAWAKVPLIRELLDAYAHVLWIDADAIVLDGTRDIRDELAPDAVMAIAEHVIGGSHQPNSGVWLVRSSPEARLMLDWVWGAEEYIHHMWWENAALMDLLGYRLHPGARVRPSWLHARTTWLDKAWNSIPLDPAPAPYIKHYAGEPHEVRLRGLAADARAARPAGARRPRPHPQPRDGEAAAALCVVRGDFGGSHSLAVVNDGLADALEQRGHRVVRAPRGAAADPSPVPGVSHGWPPDFAPAAGGPAVTVLPWEFGSPPVAWVERIRASIDRVWVPSAYVRDAYLAAGVPERLVEVVPNGVDLERFRPDGPRRELGIDAACTFLFVGGTIWRKGIDLLVAAWRRAFTAADDVALVVKDFGTRTWYRGQDAGAALRQLAGDPTVASVLYLDDEVPPEAMPSLYRAADVLVAPYRGEGFCLPVLEAMACGVSAIHTAEGPTREFCPDAAGWPVAAARIPLAAPALRSIGPLAGPGWVHEVDVDALAEALRAAAQRPDERRARGEAAVRAARRWTWDAAAQCAERSLCELARQPLSWLARDNPAPALDTRGASVLYAPDWSRAAWVETLAQWSRAFRADDPVTLVLKPPVTDRGRLLAHVGERLRAAGVDPDRMPDVLVAGIEPREIHGMVAGADAVLVDGAQDNEADKPLWRRARRLVRAEAEGLRALRAELVG